MKGTFLKQGTAPSRCISRVALCLLGSKSHPPSSGGKNSAGIHGTRVEVCKKPKALGLLCAAQNGLGTAAAQGPGAGP